MSLLPGINWSGLEGHLLPLPSLDLTKYLLNKGDQDVSPYSLSNDQDYELCLQQMDVPHRTIPTLLLASIANLGTGEWTGPFGEAVFIRRQ